MRGLVLLALALACGKESSAPPEGTPPPEGTDWRDEVIYQLVIDRFANGDPQNDQGVDAANPKAYHGGDFQGVIDQIPYLQALGVTAVWVSPVVKQVDSSPGSTSFAFHGYWAADLGAVNPHFGDRASLQAMVGALHAAGIKVILDVVTNHMGRVFFYDRNGNGQLDGAAEMAPEFDGRGVLRDGSTDLAPLVWLEGVEVGPEPFRNPDFYHRRGRIVSYEDPTQAEQGDFGSGLRDLATEKPEVRAALVEVMKKWLDDVPFDGIRFDTVKHVELDFWQGFCPALRTHVAAQGRRNFFMFGEAFEGNDQKLGAYTRGGALDSVLYFSQKYAVFDAVFKEGGPTRKVDELLVERQRNHEGRPHEGGVGVAPRDLLVSFFDNHDVPRFLAEKPSVEALRSALVYLFTWDGVPAIYYGTEQELSGGADPANREDLWSTGYRTDGATFAHIRKLIALRKELVPLRRGTIELRWTSDRTGDEPDAGILAFERRYERDTVLVVINVHDRKASETGAVALGFGPMKTGFAEGTILRDRLSDGGETYTVGPAGALSIQVPPRGALVLVPSK